jgi:hypothetical protein
LIWNGTTICTIRAIIANTMIVATGPVSGRLGYRALCSP